MYYECVTDGGASLAYLDLGAREGPARVYLGGLGSAGTVGFAPVAGHPLLAGTGRHVLVDLIAERPVSFRDQLAALDVPRHYVGGGRSGEDLEPLRAAGCTVHVVPDTGHVMMWDDLDGFVAALHDAGHS